MLIGNLDQNNCGGCLLLLVELASYSSTSIVSMMPASQKNGWMLYVVSVGDDGWWIGFFEILGTNLLESRIMSSFILNSKNYTSVIVPLEAALHCKLIQQHPPADGACMFVRHVNLKLN